MALNQVLLQCVDNWHREGIELAPPFDVEDIRQLWERLDRRASDDVLELYSTIGGFADGELYGDFLWCLWPLDVILSENKDDPSIGVQFCDHSIDVVRWEVRSEDKQHSSVWLICPGEQRESQQVAPTLELFFEMLSDDPWRLL